MNTKSTTPSHIQELYEVAVEYVIDGSFQVDKAYRVIELIEDGEYEQAVKVGMVY